MTRIPFHPLLFAMLPVLSMVAANPGEAHEHALRDGLRVALAFAGFLVLGAAGVYRDFRKAALWVSVLLIVIAGFDSFHEAIEPIRIAGWHPARRRYVLPLTYLALAACGVWIHRQHAAVGRLTGLANIVALGAVLPPTVLLGVAERKFGPDRTLVTAREIVAGRVVSKPDIYYFVFDRYGDEQTARDLGLDNDIDAYLTAKGFYVPPESRANYIRTALSLASSLNAEYLDDIARGRDGSSDWWPVYERIESHRVGAFLRSQGYSYTHVGPAYYPTLENPQATRNLNHYSVAPSEVTRLLDSVALAPVHRLLRNPWLDERLQSWHRTRRQVDDVLRLVPEPGPKFVFLHVMVPHPPYVFDRDGSYVTRDQQNRRTFAENYTNSVVAANAMIRQLVDAILRNSSSPPVIIVQADEGPYPPGTGADTFDWRTAGVAQLHMRSRILNAYHLPGVDSRVLYPTITPVNSFRIVFNAYFGTHLPLLPDRTFRHVATVQPFPFDDITPLLSDTTRLARSTVQ
jgi:hypothetical protein